MRQAEVKRHTGKSWGIKIINKQKPSSRQANTEKQSAEITVAPNIDGI